MAEPSDPTDAATKRYVDSVAQGLDAKQSVKVATTTNGTFFENNYSSFDPGEFIDGVILNPGDRILIKNQTDKTKNGIYIVNPGGGAPVRAEDFNENSEFESAFVFVEQGNTNKDTGWVCTTDFGQLDNGTTDIEFVQFSSAGVIEAGTGLDKTGNTISIPTTTLATSSPSLSKTNPVNTTSGDITVMSSKLQRVYDEYLLSCVFKIDNVSSKNDPTGFEITLPEKSNNFSNDYELSCIVTGFYAEQGGSILSNIENAYAYGMSGTNKAKISFTSGDELSHDIYVQVFARYTL